MFEDFVISLEYLLIKLKEKIYALLNSFHAMSNNCCNA